MENVQELSAKANRYRELARRMTDEKAKGALLELAEEYDRLVRSMRDRGDEQVG